MTEHNIEIPRGDTKPFRVAVVDDDGNPVNLLGAAIVYSIMPRPGLEALVTLSVGNGIAIVDPTTDGLFDILLDPADTQGLDPGVYWHEAELTESSGQESTVLTGRVVVLPTTIP